jgi:hypothetical protein
VQIQNNTLEQAQLLMFHDDTSPKTFIFEYVGSPLVEEYWVDYPVPAGAQVVINIKYDCSQTSNFTGSFWADLSTTDESNRAEVLINGTLSF